MGLSTTRRSRSRHLAALAASLVMALGVGLMPHEPVLAQGAGGGTIEGHVRLTGPAPANPLIRMGADPMCGRMNRDSGVRPVQQLVVRAADGGLANVFVEVQGITAKAAAPTEMITIDQRGCVYAPRVIGARVGQTLKIVNNDMLLHNVHGISSKGNDFNTSQPNAGMTFTYTLKSDETMLRLKCDVHSWMTAYVGVVNHPYFAVSSTAGSFTIANVPAGKHTIRAWHERYGWLTQSVDVKAGKNVVTFEYTGAEKPATADIHDLLIPTGTQAALGQ